MALALATADTDGPRFGQFCRTYIKHTKGSFAGKPVLLEEWEQDFADELLSINPDTGLRWYTEAGLLIPRKNGKTTICSCLGCYMLAADGEASPEVYIAAAAKDQAGFLFSQAKAFIQKSPALGDLLVPRRWHIECPDNGGIMRTLSSDAPKQIGSNPSANLVDELWAHETGDLYTALTSGTDARDQPLTVFISTAGFDPQSTLGQIMARAQALPDIEQRSRYLTIYRDRANGFLMYVYSVPDGDDIDDMRVVKGANPASWITEAKLLRERNKPTMREADFRRLHANQWTEAEQPWLPKGTWRSCQGKPIFDHKLPVGVGIDIGQTYDSTAVAWAQRQGDRVLLLTREWANPYPEGHPARAKWRMNTEEVRAHLRDLYRQFPTPMASVDDKAVEGPAFAYDPWHFRESAELVGAMGLNMVEFPQHANRMVPASELLYELAVTGRILHNGDPALAAHIAAATAELTQRGWKLAKPKSGRRIDQAVASAMAVWMAMMDPPTPKRHRARSF